GLMKTAPHAAWPFLDFPREHAYLISVTIAPQRIRHGLQPTDPKITGSLCRGAEQGRFLRSCGGGRRASPLGPSQPGGGPGAEGSDAHGHPYRGADKGG